jgi:arylsulfatase A-like enzyme
MTKLADHNIILVNLDGLRKDRVDLCPTLDSLKNKSYYFSNMFTAAPYTFAALHAIFSGMYPSRNGMNAYYNMFKFKSNEIVTLSQFLQKNNFYTSCDVISKVVLPNQGFDELNVFDEETVNFQERHKEIIERLSKKEKFFLFLHFTETHKHLVREIVQKYKQESNDDAYFESQEENSCRYNSHLPTCDNYVSTIIETIKKTGIDKKTILIFFSDHGTSIGERKGEKFYGVFTYDYTINVFCIINIPGDAPLMVDKQCRTIDLFSTITNMIEKEHGSEFKEVQGKSLFNLIDNSENLEREVFVETGGLYGPWPSSKKHNVFCVRINNKKLIFNSTPKTWEFYDLSLDPKELKNIFDENLVDVKFMKERLEYYFRENNIEL